MKNFSLVIKSSSDQIYNYITVLEPLIDDFNTELIIINNEQENLDTVYKHYIYKYDESSNKLMDFCNSLCTKENVVIIEEGMIITKELVEYIKNKIFNNSANVYCNVKRFLTLDREKFLISKFKLIKNNEVEDREDINIIIDDTSLLNTTDEYLDKGIALLCKNENFEELYLWYSEFILNNNIDIVQKFYELLEKKKRALDFNENKLIEKPFLISTKNDKYTMYLNIKNNYENQNKFLNSSILNSIRELGLESEDKFFCYFLFNTIKDSSFFTEICRVISTRILRDYFEYLFKHEQDFYIYLYKYLISINLEEEISKINNKNIALYSDICKLYIEFISNKSENFENKQKLIQVFIDYTNYEFYRINQLKIENRKFIINPEIKFLGEIDKAINYVNLKSIEETVSILKKAVIDFPIMSRPVEYYIQRLRFENRNYPYKISICMIIRDEEKNIERCLKSLKPLVDIGLAEFVIVDTGSKDKTVEIAKKYVKNIYFHEWQGSFSEARNYNISLAQGQYIFTMDADEEIEISELSRIISEFNTDDYEKFNTFSLKVKNFSDEKYERFSLFTRNLIFRNDGTLYFSGSVHNQPIYKLPIKHLDCTILHYGYIMTSDIKDKKFMRTATLLKKELEKNPQSIYYRFQLSVSYSMHGDLQEALEQTRIYMKIIKDKNASILENLMYFNNAALVYSNNQLYNETLEVCNKSLSIQPDFIDFIFYKCNVFFQKKEYKEAIKHLLEYLDLIDDFHYHDIMHDDRYLFYTLDSKEAAKGMLAISYNKLGQYEKCLEQSELIKDNKTFKSTLYTIIDSYIKQKKYDGISAFYRDKISNNVDVEVVEVFKYFLEEQLATMSQAEQKKCVLAFANSDLADDYIDVYRFRAGKGISQNIHRVLSFINKYDINETDSISGNMIIETIVPIVINCNYTTDLNITEIKNLKKGAEFILNRSLNLKQYDCLNKEDLLKILDKYIGICTHLISIGKDDLLENYEIPFVLNLLKAFEEINKKNFIKCIAFIKDSVLEHKKMAKPMQLFLEIIVPGYYVNENVNEKYI